ncbi:MAG: hypothetical protein E7163_01920 [Firmicutes bacterium]|nr:hypothetical protein [Bacillota bacterium]
MANNYPNGWKDGWSSADHAEQSYSPYAAERAQREAMSEAKNREAARTQYEQGLANERKAREKIEAERAQEEFIRNKREREAYERADKKTEAVKFLVEQKKAAYNQKSWFGKTMAKMRGKDFTSQYNKYYQEAENKIYAMDNHSFEVFYENNIEGKSR